ncbi:MAG: DNA polymerase IV [Bacilli bacterium]|nr:DNA polymerase IV [Bacilli bacterium]
MAKVIVHIDLNAFFARCEEIRDSSLENKPVAIGHDGRGGIVSTCSYKAREYGVSSAMPMFKAKELCPNLIIKPVDFRYYGALSDQFKNFIRRYTKKVEEASIDECFADFTDVVRGQKDVPGFFKKLQNDLYKETKLKCSIGVATTKFLAKMGSDYKKPMGLTIIRKKDIPDILYPLKIESMFGIGKKTSPKLRKMGINTIGDLAKRCEKDDRELMNELGKYYYVIKDWMSGKGSDEIIVEPEDPKSIGNSTTLMEDTMNHELIASTFKWLSKEVSERAIRENKLGSTIQIVVKESDFKVHNKSITFDNPTNDADVIFNIAMNLYDKNFSNMMIRLVGVTLQNLINTKDIAIQMSLFDYEKHEEQSSTKLLINELNRKMKKKVLIRASEVEDDGNK